MCKVFFFFLIKKIILGYLWFDGKCIFNRFVVSPKVSMRTTTRLNIYGKTKPHHSIPPLGKALALPEALSNPLSNTSSEPSDIYTRGLFPRHIPATWTSCWRGCQNAPALLYASGIAWVRDGRASARRTTEKWIKPDRGHRSMKIYTRYSCM